MSTNEQDEEEEITIDQEKILQDALQIVKAQSFQMKLSIDKNKLRNSLKYAKSMLDTLKNPLLSPSNYYILYMQVFDEMQYLYNYFKEEARRGRRMKDLYDTVQQCDNILPRLFLLISVGSVYIEAGQTTSTEVIFDLLNIIKGVQNPLRGLFCRYFLLKMIKDKLPDKGNEFEKPGATLEDSIKFILNNLDDMNRLWIRLITGIPAGDREAREKERKELKILVGENITRLASLNGITQEIYQKQVLPKIIECLLDSKDALSQEYLLECVIHAFPDEYNIACMNTLLETCSKLQKNVDVKSLFIALMNKLARFVKSDKDDKNNNLLSSTQKIFDLLKGNIDFLVSDESSTNMDTNKILELEVAFMKFTIKCAPEKDKLTTINHTLTSSVNLLGRNKTEKINNEGIRLVGDLLSAILESPLSIFDMPNFPELMKYLDFSSRTTLSLRIIDSINGSKTMKLDNNEKMSTLVDFVRPLLEDSPDSGEFNQLEFEYQQNSVCKILFLIACNDPNGMYEILLVLKNVFIKGGIKRMKYTLPCLVNAYLSLAYGVSYAIAKDNNLLDDMRVNNAIHNDYINYFTLHNIETSGLYVKFLNKIYNQINDTLTLITGEYPEITFKLYLTVATQINDIKVERAQFEEICYSSITTAIELLSEGKMNNDAKVHLLNLLIGTILSFSIFGKDNWVTIASNVQSASQSLIKRSDQCVAILNCSNLFCNGIIMDKAKVKDCLSKAKRFADFSMTNPQNAILFIYLINKYLYLIEKYEKDDFLDFINIDSVNELIELAKNHIQSMKVENKDAKCLPEIEEYYNNTICVLNARKKIGKSKILEQLIV